MQVVEKYQPISPKDLIETLKKNFSSLMAAFYEMQSSFLSSIYKKHDGIENASIIIFFTRSNHLEIIRQREKNLNFNISLEMFWENLNQITKPAEKITSIVQKTGIPKETVRRKVKKLLNTGILLNNNKDKKYTLVINKKDKLEYLDFVNKEIKNISSFIYKLNNHLNLNFNSKAVEAEVKSQFSFYWYHLLSCQLEWLKMWQIKLQDNDLILIMLQTIIPTLSHADKNIKNLNNIFINIGKMQSKFDTVKSSINATSVSQVTGIPRATCTRKLDKLVTLGLLVHQANSKRYFVNQNCGKRTTGLLSKENVNFTIELFSEYFSIILNSLVQNKK